MKRVPYLTTVSFVVALLGGAPLFTPPANGDEFRSAAQRQAYLRHIETILDSGLHADPGNLEAIERHVAAARRIRGDDPRLEYSYGLALLKGFQYRTAAEQFQRAIRTGSTVYLPAWQARIHTGLLLKDTDRLQKDLKKLAESVHDPQTQWPDERQRTKAVRFLGRVVEYLSLSEVNLLDASAVSRLDQRIRQRFDPETEKAYESGRRLTDEQHEDLLQEIEQVKGPAKARQNQAADEELAEIEKREEELKKREENLQLSREEWQAWLEERLEQAEEQLGVLQKDYRVLQGAAASVSAKMAAIQRELTALGLRRDLQRNRRSRRTRRSRQIGFAVAQRQQELLKYQTRYNALQQQALGVTAQARAVLNRRKAAVERFQQATGELVKQSESLKKWEKILEQSERQASEETSEQPLEVRLLSKRLALPSTYFELDLEAEKKRILDSYGVSESK